MALLDRLRALLRSPGASAAMRIGGTTSSVGWTTARVADAVYSNPTGYRCTEMRANAFSRPDWVVRKPDTEDVIENSPVLDILNHNMVSGGVRLSATQSQKTIQRDVVLNGRSTWLKRQGQADDAIAGPTTGLMRLNPQRTTVMANEDDELLGFMYTDKKGGRFPLLPEQMVYLRYPHPTRDYDSLAPALAAGLGAETDSAAARFNFDLLANDGALPGYITVENMTPSEFAEWKAAWESGEYPGKTRFMGGNAKYIKVGQSNKDLLYDQLRGMSKQDMCHALGVLSVLLDPTDATFANMGEARSWFIQQTILPDWILVGDEFTEQLGAEFGVEIAMKLDDIEELGEAEEAIIDRGIKLLDRKVITINKFREDQGWEPVSWGDVPAAPLAPMAAQPMQPETAPAPTAPPSGGKAHVVPNVKAKAPKGRKLTVDNALVERQQSRVERKMAAFFRRQGKVVVAKVRGKAGKSLKARPQFNELIDRARWDGELADDAADMYSDVILALGSYTSEQLGGAFDANAARVGKWIKQRSVGVASLVNDTTETEVRQMLAKAVDDGLGIDAMADQLSEYFESTYRATAFARTETLGASNFATVEAAKQSGVGVGKTWLTAGDCVDECQDLDGETVGMDESFSSGDDFPPNHVNCRCTVLIQTDSGATEEDASDE